MYNVEAPIVLRCELCNKPFDKESTLKRHGYYCRSRRIGSTIRNRSCITCVKAKARCDNKRPECSRCLGKAIKCHYPTNTLLATGQRRKRTQDGENQSQTGVPDPILNCPQVHGHQLRDNEADTYFGTGLDILDPDFTGFEEGFLNTAIDFSDFWTPQTNNNDFQNRSSESPYLANTPTSSMMGKDYLPHTLYNYNLSIQPSPTNAVRSFHHRLKLKTGTHRIAQLILHTLKSYPLMMMRDNSLPPFIHPHLISTDVGNIDMEPMTNCISLVHMLNNQVSANRKLFWKNVRMECERFCVKHQQLNRWELLAAMQALSIYTLIRLEEGETDYNDFDSLLVAAVTAIATQFNSVYTINTQLVAKTNDLHQVWKEWILKESAQRLCVIYQVVNMLVYFEPAAMCDLHETELLLAPLPTKRQLWEARDEFMWKMQNEKDPDGLQAAFGLATNGDLVRVDKGQVVFGDTPESPSKLANSMPLTRNTAKWEEWCAGMDGLGGLVMLAASLVS